MNESRYNMNKQLQPNVRFSVRIRFGFGTPYISLRQFIQNTILFFY